MVSATGRNILPSRQAPGLYLDMIQTDAPINPGNSGGPLANALGNVIGVNSSIFTQSGESIGLGFAIPIERALRVADEIIKSGAVRRAWTGLDVAGRRQHAGMEELGRRAGARRVAPGGPAARAGIRAGAILVEANGRPLRNFLDWEAVKLDLHVGDAVTVVEREGARTVPRRITTADLPTVSAAKVNVLRGLELVTVTPAVQTERRIRSEQGALVFRVTAGSEQRRGPGRGRRDHRHQSHAGDHGPAGRAISWARFGPASRSGSTSSAEDRWASRISRSDERRSLAVAARRALRLAGDARLWGAAHRIGLWRRLWLALAEAERELGVAIPDAAIDADARAPRRHRLRRRPRRTRSSSATT